MHGFHLLSLFLTPLPSPSLTVLCAERVAQMTKTYNDIDAVTRLLEEVRHFTFMHFNLGPKRGLRNPINGFSSQSEEMLQLRFGTGGWSPHAMMCLTRHVLTHPAAQSRGVPWTHRRTHTCCGQLRNASLKCNREPVQCKSEQ